MPRPVGHGQRYMPGLDGLRAVAVGAVVLYHLDVGWLPGGLLGVGVFFTLSGYLITDLLLGQAAADGRLRLREFWVRRARRLLPALLALLVVVVVWVAAGDRAELGALRGQVVSAALYVNNWWLVVHHVSYFDRFGPPSPLGHLWSLAVEEQFYLLWPSIVLTVAVWAARRRRRVGGRGALLVVSLVLAAASAAEMALLYHPGFDPTRVYDGTDTRAFELLLGAALAAVWPSRDLPGCSGGWARLGLDALGVAGLAGIVALMVRTDQYSAFAYRGGMGVLSLATLAVLVSATHPASRFGRVLGWGPLRWIGLISYGIYLWHEPIIVLTTPARAHGPDPLRSSLQVASAVAVAALSWRYLEAPIRRGALGRLWAQVRAPGRRPAHLLHRGWIAAALVAGAVVAGGTALVGTLPAAPPGTLAALDRPAPSLGRQVSESEVVGPPVEGPATARAPVDPTTAVPRPTTRCSAVAHIGDSTSESLVSSDYLPPTQQLPAQYARVGVHDVVLEISGARSLVETLPGQQNGQEVAQQLLAQGYHGCWVIALGTNDAANIAVGSPVSAAQRIQDLMQLLGNQPVLWVNVVSLLSTGPYANANMQAWNQALLQGCSRFPTMRVLDWASLAQPSWFISDGIHYDSAGSAARAAAMANGLATAFPSSAPASSSVAAKGAKASCLVR